VGLFLGFLLLPAIIAVPASFNGTEDLRFPPQQLTWHWYQEFFKDPNWLSATWLSAQIAALASLLALVVGVPAAIALVRHRFPGWKIATAILMAPLAIPLVVVATGLLIILLRIHALGTPWTLVFAHAVLAQPVVILVLSAALARLDPTLEDAARGLGASRILTLRRVVLPAILPSIIAAAILAFVVSWDEVVLATFLLSGATGVTLPVKIFGYIKDSVTPTPAAIATMLMALTILALGMALAILRSLSTTAQLERAARRQPGPR
jgi:putative spermidine/putrescine transport system permease protein